MVAQKKLATVPATVPATGGIKAGSEPKKAKPQGATGTRGKGKKLLYVVGSSIKVAKAVKPNKKQDADSTYATRAEDGSAQISIDGHRLVRILRWMGHHGANVAEAAQWMLNAGYTISPTTLNAQVTSGRAGRPGNEAGYEPGGFRGPVAEFTPAQAKWWLSIRPPA